MRERSAEIVEEEFSVAQAMLYVFSIVQIVIALAMALAPLPAGITPEVWTMQEISARTHGVINIPIGSYTKANTMMRSGRVCVSGSRAETQAADGSDK